VCSREVDGRDFCEFHVKAYQNIVEKYAFWKRACEISWKEYLSEIAKNPLAGEWIKEVAEYLAKSGECPDVTGS
jgi:hypothetical protein